MKVDWNLSHAYRMVRQRDHALTDRQRKLQGEQEILSKQIKTLLEKIENLGDAIAVVEKAGGDASSLRTQISAAHAEKRRIEPRHTYLDTVTSLIAENLRLTGQAHDALHWLNFVNATLEEFDKQPEVMIGEPNADFRVAG
jgi:chromosome segregation ATPase